MKKFNIGLWIFLLLAICLSCFGLLNETIPGGHDLIFHLSRIEAISKGLQFGEFPVRIYPDYFYGYGYANGIMYPDLFLYPAALLCLVGVDVILAYKIMILVYTALTAIFIYRALIKITHHEWASRLGMLLYTVSLYRIVDVWTRAALGEVLAFMFIPFILLGIYYIFFDDERKWYELTIGFSGVFLSHLLSGSMWCEVMVAICLFSIIKLFRHRKRLWSLIKATMMSILLVSYCLFPMFELLMNQKFRVSDNSNYDLNWLFSLKDVFLTYSISGSPDDWFPGGVGISIIGIVLLGMLAQRQEATQRQKNVAWIGVIISFMVLIMTSHLFPWHFVLKYIPIFARLQFPWRLLMIATSFLTLAFTLFYSLSSQIGKILGIIIVAWSVWLGVQAEYETINYYDPILVDPLARTDTSSNSITDRHYTVGNGEYIPLETDNDLMIERENQYFVNQDIDYVANQVGTTITIKFSGQTQPDLEIKVPLLYYKGYGAKLNDESLEVGSGDNGVVRVIVRDIVGEGMIVVSYEGTILQKVTLVVSICSLIGFIGIILFSKSRKRHSF